MTHYFEKTIVDAKTIYTDYLLNILTPILYFGVKHIYKDAQKMDAQLIELEKINPEVKNPGVLILFQHFLMALDKWTDAMVEQETNRIKGECGCSEIFDDLVRATIKSHIIVLTYTASKKTCKIILEKLHEDVSINKFIHCCYLECSKIFVDHPTLFYHDFPNIELKENERKIYYLIKVGIKNAIKRVLPMKQILTQYLGNDYIELDEENQNESLLKMKDLIQRDLHGQLNLGDDEGGRNRIIDSDQTSIDYNLGRIESLIHGRNLDDTFDIEIIKDEISKPSIFEPSNIDDQFADIVGKSKNEQIQEQILEQIQEQIQEQVQEEVKVQEQVQEPLLADDEINVVKDIVKNNLEKYISEKHISEKNVSDQKQDQKQDQKTEDRFNNIFAPSRGNKKSKNLIGDAIKSLKNDDIRIDKSAGIVNNVNENDNYFGEVAN
jgi:hypothetical protein